MSDRFLEDSFKAVGGRFPIPVKALRNKLDDCRAMVFDWDGVFNDGRKGGGTASGFSEADSMGTNMLRYGLWHRHGKLPYTAIITGEDNRGAIEFAEREHFSAIYSRVRRKQEVVAHLCEHNGLEPGQVACVFDDINDLAMAGTCGLRLLVRRDSSPLFVQFVERGNFCDYVSGANAGGHAVREICELLLGAMNLYGKVVMSRLDSDDSYARYFAARQAATTIAYMQDENGIRKS